MKKPQHRQDYELKRAYAQIERMVARYSEKDKREMFLVGGPVELATGVEPATS